jgi:hypothetical protein
MNFIRSLIKRNSQVRNIYHPDIKDKVEYAFSLNGKAYYRFKEDHLMNEMRRFQKILFLTELENGLSHDDLLAYIDKIEEKNNKGLVGDTGVILGLLKQRIQVAKDPDTFYKIASVDYFDEDEELTQYDRKYNVKKIEEFKESKELPFFLTRPMIDIFPQLESLGSDSKVFLNQLEEMRELKTQIDSLTLEQSSRKL